MGNQYSMCPGMVPGFIVPGYGRGLHRRGLVRTLSGTAKYHSSNSLDGEIWVHESSTMDNYGSIQRQHGQSSISERRQAGRERLETNLARDPLLFPLVRQKSGGWKSQQRLR